MRKEIFLCFIMLVSSSNIYCFNLNNPKTKALLTTIKCGAGITFSWALLAIVSDREISAKEKMCLITFSTFFSALLSGFVAKLDPSPPMQEALMLKRARNTGILCGLVLPITACLTNYVGKDPRNIRTILGSVNEILK